MPCGALGAVGVRALWILRLCGGQHVSHPRTYAPLAFFDFLMSAVFDHPDNLEASHRADLQKSGLSEVTIRQQRFRSVPPDTFDHLLGYRVSPAVVSMLLIPYYESTGALMPHIRVKLFPPITDGRDGHTVRYLQPRSTRPRLFFPLAALDRILASTDPLVICEGEKKGCAIAEIGRPVVAIPGIDSWRAPGSARLMKDFDAIPLHGRAVEIIPDSDFRTNRTVAAAVGALATALAMHGARAEVLILPDEVPAS
jgi:Domain of unknown function (DUF3854)